MPCRSFEGALAALGAPLVGIIAENVFNFPTGQQTYVCISGQPVDSDLAARSGRARALGDAMLTCMIVPWALCLAIYTLLHWTYPEDRKRAQNMLQRIPSYLPGLSEHGSEDGIASHPV